MLNCVKTKKSNRHLLVDRRPEFQIMWIEFIRDCLFKVVAGSEEKLHSLIQRKQVLCEQASYSMAKKTEDNTEILQEFDRLETDMNGIGTSDRLI